MSIKDFAYEIKYNSDLLAEVVSACRGMLYLPEATKYRNYIFGRLSKSTIDTYNIGYFPPNEQLDLLTARVSSTILTKLGILKPKNIYSGGFTIFNYHNIIFPFLDEYNNIVSLSGRSILSQEEMDKLEIQKYKNLFNFRKTLHLFGLNHSKLHIEEQDCAILVEGQVDQMKCFERGILNAVALTGSAVSPYHIYLLKKRANKIYLLFDNDVAGRKAEENTIKRYSNHIDIQVLEFPNGYSDIDEYLKANSGNEFKKLYGTENIKI